MTSRAGEARSKVLVVYPGPDSAGGMRQVVDVLCGSQLTERYDMRLIGLHRDGSMSAKGFAAARGLTRMFWILSSGTVDLAWIHATKGASLRRKSVAAALCRVFGVPYVLHLHNANVEEYLCGVSGLERRAIQATIRSAARVLVLSSTWRTWLQAFTPCRVTPVPNPVDVPQLTGPREVDAGLILQVGRVGQRKGSLLTLAAVASIRGEFPQVHVIFAGDGDTAAVSARAGALGIRQQVTMAGWLPVEDVHRRVARAALVALPSSAEGLPMAVLEAMARAVPVVCTPVGGLAEVITDGVNGRLVPLGDPEALAAAFADLLADPQSARRLGEAGRRTVEGKYATPLVAEQIAAVFDAVLADSPSGGD